MPAEHEKPFGMDEPASVTPAEHRQGLVHLARVSGAIAVIACATYLVPGTDAVRPWAPGEGIPIVRLFGDGEPAPETGIAEITGGEEAGEGEGGDLEGAVIANLDDPEEHDPAADIQEVQHGVTIDPSELEGLTETIHDPSGSAMRAFYDALLRTAREEPGAITRVAHFGDSSIALDGITQTVRQRLQARFGDAGHGFVLAARGTLPYRHRDVRHESEGGWRLMDISHAPLRDGHYGLGGYQARSVMGAEAYFASADEGSPVGTSISRFELFYERHPRGGRVEIRVDGGPPALLDTRGEPIADEVHRIEVPDGRHRFDIRTAGHGETHLYGVVLERAGPGVVYDSLGMVGARARRFLGFDEEHLRRQLALRGTNLVVIGYGGNDADDRRDEGDFLDDFRRVARHVRAARPEASCLLFAPLDQARRDDRGQIRTMETVPRIVAAMRAAAEAEGCAFFDTWTAMGGDGAMSRWYRARPRLAFGDLRHATPAGYRVLGNMFYKALLRGFADHLDATTPR